MDIIEEMAEAIRRVRENEAAKRGEPTIDVLGPLAIDLEMVRAALSAALERGWVMVPVEPTQYMRDLSGTPRAADIWRHMLAARPSISAAPRAGI